MDFEFDLAEPLQTHTTSHQRNFSRSALSNIKFEPRTAEQREADARRNAPKYAREKAVGSMLTARFLRAKKALDGYYGYDIDAAWDGDAGQWRVEADPWLRIGAEGQGQAVVEEFLRGYTKRRVEEDGLREGKAVETEALTGDELEALAKAVLRVARVDLEAVGRDAAVLDEGFKRRAMGVVEELKEEYKLPQSAPEGDDDDVELDGEGVNGA